MNNNEDCSFLEDIKYLTRIMKKRVRDARKRSKKKGLEFDITFSQVRDQFMAQKGRCHYTKEPFRRNYSVARLSLERLNSNLGYTKSNVVWCWSFVNKAKQDRPYKEFRRICYLLLKVRVN